MVLLWSNKKLPLSFLAQINCEEIKRYDEDDLLPPKGILYFFYELSTMNWGIYPEDKGSAKVYYFDGDVSELVRTNFPKDLQDEFKLPEMHLNFNKKSELPDYQEFIEYGYEGWEGYSSECWERYELVKSEKGYNGYVTDAKLLGYANLIQSGMLRHCEEMNDKVRGGNTSEVTSEKVVTFETNVEQWQLLFQLDTITTNNYELAFGDFGRIYFYIKRDDLKKCNFEDCWLFMQCH